MNPKLKIFEIILLIAVLIGGGWWLARITLIGNPCNVNDPEDLILVMRNQFRRYEYIDVIVGLKGGGNHAEAERIEDQALAIFEKDEFKFRGKGSSINPWISGHISKSGFEKIFQFEEFKDIGPNCSGQAI